MPELSPILYKETRSSLRKDPRYRKLISDFTSKMNFRGVWQFDAKALIEPPLTVAALYYSKDKIEDTDLESELGFNTKAPRRDVLRREVSRFIYELEDEVANMDEEFASVCELTHWMGRFDSCSAVSAMFRRGIPENRDLKLMERHKDLVSVVVKLKAIRTVFFQERVGRTIFDSVRVSGPGGDMLYEKHWHREMGFFEWMYVTAAFWKAGSVFSWAVVDDIERMTRKIRRQKKQVRE